MRQVVRNWHLGLVFTIDDSAVTEKHRKECRLSLGAILSEADPSYYPEGFTVSAESGKLVLGAEFKDEALALEVKAGHIKISTVSEPIRETLSGITEDKDLIMAQAVGDVLAQQEQQHHYAQHGHMPGHRDCLSGVPLKQEFRANDLLGFAGRWPSWMPAPLNGDQLKELMEALRRHDRFLGLGSEVYGINSKAFLALDPERIPVCCLDGLPAKPALMFLTAYQSYLKSITTEREATPFQRLVSDIVDRG